eukprot:COSAG03_NODE_2191_length_3026_cov_7.622139_1_plen_46_part_10
MANLRCHLRERRSRSIVTIRVRRSKLELRTLRNKRSVCVCAFLSLS